MSLRIGINGFGRIGRLVFRAAMMRSDITVVGINDLLNVEHLAYLLKYDSVHGTFSGSIEIKDKDLVVNNEVIKVSAERNPEDIPWKKLQTDVVAECTGIFTSLELAQKHIVKANFIDDKPIGNDKVQGILYDIEGPTATHYQFFLAVL